MVLQCVPCTGHHHGFSLCMNMSLFTHKLARRSDLGHYMQHLLLALSSHVLLCHCWT